MDDAQRYIQEHYWIDATPPPGARFAWLRRLVARAVAHVFRGQNEFNANVVRTLNALTTAQDEQRQRTDTFAAHLATLQTQYTVLQHTFEQHRDLLNHHGSVIAALHTRVDDTGATLASLSKDSTARQDALVRVQEQLATRLAGLTRRQDDLVRSLEQVQHTIAGATARQDELVATCAEISTTTAMLAREHRELVVQLTAAQQSAAGTSARQDDLVRSLEQMQRAIAGVTAHHDDLLAQVARLDAALQAQFADALARLQRDEAGFQALHALTDRLREETDAVKGALGAALARVAPAASKPAAAARTQAAATLADVAYTRFEESQRGDEASVRERLRWYLPVLAGVSTTPTQCVLDLGCGRGEFLQLLAEHKLHARGVDINSVAMHHARRAKLQVKAADLFDELAATRPGTLAAISAFHVLEHLPFEAQVRLFRLAHAALRPDGLLLLEFPNILSIAVAASEFYKDPTHVRPVHPVTVQHWLQEAGFTRIAVSFLHPYPAEAQLAAAQDDAGTIARLNDLLFGHRDCAVVAHKSSVSSPTGHST